MKLTNVESSDITAIGFERTNDGDEIHFTATSGTVTHTRPACGTLEVVFKRDGRRARYYDVPETVYNAIMQAPSKGKALRGMVTSKAYAWEYVTTEREEQNTPCIACGEYGSPCINPKCTLNQTTERKAGA